MSMRSDYGSGQQLGLAKPGPALKAVLVSVFVIWVVFALAINWGDASEAVFMLFVGNAEAILNGQLWRLVTPMFMHMPAGISHILFTLLGLYFLGQSLEEAWGPRRFVGFLLWSGTLAYAVQFVAALALPSYFRERLVPSEWFGATPIVEAIAVAWALSFKGRVIQLFFVLPVSSRGLLLMVIGANILMVIAGAPNLAGHVAMFAGMGAGWLLGGGSPSPFRRLLLKLRLKQLQQEQSRIDEQRKARIKRSNLRVIPGGRRDDSSPDDKTWLN